MFCFAYERHPSIDPTLWNSLAPYFLPENHPIKNKLDRIFTKSRAIEDLRSLHRAGFSTTKPRRWTRLVVTSHKKVPGYIFKLYLDSQRFHQKQPEHHFWVLRIKGAQLIREEIKKRGLQEIYKVPKKWIYPLPVHPSPSQEARRKNFILVEQNMEIYPDSKNEKIWGSEKVTAPFLQTFYRFVSDLGLWDCAKPANAPFAKDGRIAFIDTQSFYRWPVKYDRLTPFLSPPMQDYWNQLLLNP